MGFNQQGERDSWSTRQYVFGAEAEFNCACVRVVKKKKDRYRVIPPSMLSYSSFSDHHSIIRTYFSFFLLQTEIFFGPFWQEAKNHFRQKNTQQTIAKYYANLIKSSRYVQITYQALQPAVHLHCPDLTSFCLPQPRFRFRDKQNKYIS